MKSFKLKLWFKWWWPFPRTYNVISHALIKEFEVLELYIDNGETVLYKQKDLYKMLFSPEYRVIMQERFEAEQARKMGTPPVAPPVQAPVAPVLAPEVV